MKNQHTPGPWEFLPTLKQPGKIDLIPVGRTDYTVASVHAYGENANANAQLIASAPEMLAALYVALPWVEAQLDDPVNKIGAVKRAVESIRAAIAKAEGYYDLAIKIEDTNK